MATITAVFTNPTEAEEALADLHDVGFTTQDIGVLMTEQARGKHFALKENTKTFEGTGAGATVGGILGAVAAALTAVGAIAIPGVGLLAAGPVAAAFAGGGAGAAAGGLLGALIGLGIPEHEAKFNEEAVNGGSILLAVDASGDKADQVKKIFKLHHAQNIAA